MPLHQPYGVSRKLPDQMQIRAKLFEGSCEARHQTTLLSNKHLAPHTKINDHQLQHTQITWNAQLKCDIHVKILVNRPAIYIKSPQ